MAKTYYFFVKNEAFLFTLLYRIGFCGEIFVKAIETFCDFW